MGRPKIKKRDETVLLTGATGFTGANLAIRLVNEGYDVHAITRKTSDKWRLSTVLNQIVDHVVDLRENDKLKETINKINPDIVFHLATAGVYGGNISLIETLLMSISLAHSILSMPAKRSITDVSLTRAARPSMVPKITL